MFDAQYFGGVILFLVIALAVSMFRVLREYERGVIFMLGRFYKVKGPGLIIVIPVLQQMVRVDLRTVVMDVPTQDVISRDNVSVQVNAVIYFRVIDPEKAIIQVENFLEATSQLSQTTLRSVLGQHELDDMLAEREQLNADVQKILDKQTAAWGIKVATRRKPRKNWRKPPTCWQARTRRSSCATCRPWWKSPATRAPPSFSLCRLILWRSLSPDCRGRLAASSAIAN
jgi:regulator of protease activity HflC (stomatin/prohibitin superfamily)